MNIEKMIEEFYKAGSLEDILEEDISPEKVRTLFEVYYYGGIDGFNNFCKNNDNYEFEHTCLAFNVIIENNPILEKQIFGSKGRKRD